jgi:hypothetical protein
VSRKTTALTSKHGLAEEAVQKAHENHSSRGRHCCAGDEAGAVLILALAYILAISLIVGAMADWAMNDLNNTKHFNSTSQLHIAVSSVTNLAIQNIRYTPDPSTPTSNPTGLGTCWVPQPVGSPAFSQYLIDTYTVAVWCNTSTDFSSEMTRTVTFYACLSSLSSSSSPSAISTAMTNCSNSPLLTAVVVFDDYPAQGAPGQTVQCNAPQGLGQCGEGMDLQSWIWS